MSLTTSVLYDDAVALVVLGGELDLSVVGRVDDAVCRALEAGRRLVLLDLDELRFCDSSGLGALLRASRMVHETGGTCLVAGARGPVLRLLALTSTERVLQIEPEVQSALVRLRQAASESSH